MKYELSVTTRFKKDFRKALKQGRNSKLMDEVVGLLVAGNTLPEKFKDHFLTGKWSGYKECHILPDWLLIYRIEKNILVLTLSRTGSHSELFD